MNIIESLRRTLQLLIITWIAKKYPSEWWLRGGWAVEYISGKSKPHKDIDLYVLDTSLIVKRRKVLGKIFKLDIETITPHANGKYFLTNLPGCGGGYWVPKEFFEEREREICGVKARTIAPEVIYLCARIYTKIVPLGIQSYTKIVMEEFINPSILQKLEKSIRPYSPLENF